MKLPQKSCSKKKLVVMSAGGSLTRYACRLRQSVAAVAVVSPALRSWSSGEKPSREEDTDRGAADLGTRERGDRSRAALSTRFGLALTQSTPLRTSSKASTLARSRSV